MLTIKHNMDRDGTSYKLGLQAENGFVSFAKSKGWDITTASFTDDTRNHIDFHLTKDGKTIKVDVKSEKRVSRKDATTQNDLIWIEILNVSGNKGWLYGSSTHIAFQDGDTYLVVDRTRLVERVNELVTGKEVKTASEALYSLYTRFRRKDLLTLVKRSDIVDLHEEI